MDDAGGNVDIQEFIEVCKMRHRSPESRSFSDNPPEVGDTLYLQPNGVGSNHSSAMSSSISLELLGCKSDSYMILSKPDGLKSLSLNSGRDHVLHYCKDDSIYTIKSQSGRTLGPPYNCTMFKSPDKALETRPRMCERLACGAPATIREAPSRKVYVLDISARGARLYFSDWGPMPTEIMLTFCLPNGANVNNLACKVRHTHMLKDSWQTGVSFVQTDPNMSMVYDYLSLFDDCNKIHKISKCLYNSMKRNILLKLIKFSFNIETSFFY